MNAKELIMGGGNPQSLVEDPGDDYPGNERPNRPMRPPGAGNAPRRPRPGAPGEEGAPGGSTMFTPQERKLLSQLVVLDMAFALGGGDFWDGLAKIAIDGADPTPDQLTHFLDEAGKYQAQFKPGMNDLMEKISKLRFPS